MAVTNDDLELPLYLAPTASDMASYLGITPASLHSMLSRVRHHKKERVHAVKVVTLTDQELGKPSKEEL